MNLIRRPVLTNQTQFDKELERIGVTQMLQFSR